MECERERSVALLFCFQLARQKLNEMTHALCVLELFALGDTKGAHNIVLGNTLAADGHRDQKFDILLQIRPMALIGRLMRQSLLM